MKMLRTTIWVIALSAVFSCQKENETPAPGTLEGIDARAAKPSSIQYGRVKDIDGNVYKTVKIGNQVWMAENLRVSRYRNGDAIANVTDANAWSALTDTKSGGWCHYENNPAYEQPYGKLYNWFAVTDPRGLAPRGWHIPSDQEWQALLDALGGETLAGGALKSTLTLWAVPNEGATNSSGFGAIPGGYRYADGVTFLGMTYDGNYWTSSRDESANIAAWYRKFHFMSTSVVKQSGLYGDGIAVRCIKD